MPFRSSRLLVILLLLFCVLVTKNAWLTDDAYITFRTVENALYGHGLVYNVGDRVQSYTHPLWMFILVGLKALFGDLYYTAIATSILMAVIAVAMVLRSAADRRSMLLAFGALLASKAFCDFSTSGLENPLSYLLLAIFMIWTAAEVKGRRHLLAGMLLLSALALTRLDNLLLVLPVLIYEFRGARARESLAAAAIGLSPLIAWTAFSLLYYGSLIPNTAYAKLGSGLPLMQLLPKGLHYLVDSLMRDPVTLITIATGLVVAFAGKRKQSVLWAVGIVLYLGYVVAAGGDFMSGRFLASSLLIAAALIARHCGAWGKARLIIAASVIILSVMQSGVTHLLSGPRFGAATYDYRVGLSPVKPCLFDEFGICDERGFYFGATGLFRVDYGAFPSDWWPKAGIEARVAGQKVIDGATVGALGFFGYYAGPSVHIIDVNALCDFLLARLPISNDSVWRIGHFTRAIPPGYLESLSSGENLIEDPDLAKFYDAVDLTVRQPLLAPGRFNAIWRMNTGGYNHLIKSFEARRRSGAVSPEDS